MKKPEKINLVPILDAVFIFIFFLLMSAQFVDVYEIGSKLPMTKEADRDENKEPLNLTVEVKKDEIIIKTGLRTVKTKKFSWEDEALINSYLVDLKNKHQDENTVIVRADKKVSFQDLVKAIDLTQSENEKLFEQIVFDNQGAK
ncbi:MAG TPA: biopolymer transporter ExbD [Bacteriovoracaceae bacterium]|nr:biopolymer transporter ExbD [Bacteriovoracaceae bacterium]